VPNANKFVWKGKGKAWEKAPEREAGTGEKRDRGPQQSRDDGGGGANAAEAVHGSDGDGVEIGVNGAASEEQEENLEGAEEGQSESGEDDEFAKMVSGVTLSEGEGG
jgi:hypothetical protein